MRWLFLSDEFPWPLHHGTFLRVVHLARSLVAAGQSVELLSSPPADDSAIENFTAATGCSIICSENIDLQYIPCRLHCYNASLLDKIDAIGSGYDVIVVFHARSLVFVETLRKRLPSALIIADLIDDYSLEQRRRFKGDFPHLLQMARRVKYTREHRQIERAAIKFVDHFSFVSDSDARSFAMAHGARSSAAAIANGVDIDYFRPQIAEDDKNDTVVAQNNAPVIVFPGRFIHPPNVQAARWLVENLAAPLRSIYCDIEIVLLGADPPPSLLELDERPNITVTGYVDDIRPQLWRSDLAVLPMLSGTGIKNKLLEAWAAGVPVVATPLAAKDTAAVDGENILLAAAGVQMLKSIVKALDNSALRNRLATAGLKTAAESYSWAAAAEKFLNLARPQRP